MSNSNGELMGVGLLIMCCILLGTFLHCTQNIPQYEIDKAVTACADNGGVYKYKVAFNHLQVCICTDGSKFYVED